MRALVVGTTVVILAGIMVARSIDSPASDHPVGPVEESAYWVLDGQAEPLKAAFNRDAGKVRVLMLVAPT